MKRQELTLIPDEVWDRIRFCGRVYAVVAYAQRNPRPLSLESAAAIAGMERTSFCRLFKQRVGMCFSEFLSSYRLERAAQLMAGTDRSLQAIATDVGFGSLATFRRHFVRVLGRTPSELRAGRLAGQRAVLSVSRTDRATSTGHDPVRRGGTESTFAHHPLD